MSGIWLGKVAGYFQKNGSELIKCSFKELKCAWKRENDWKHLFATIRLRSSRKIEISGIRSQP